VVIGEDYKLKKKALRWQELLEVPFIGRERGSDIRTTYEGWFEQKGIKVKPAIELNSTEAIKSAVQAGLGFSILPWCTVEQDVRSGLLRVLSLPYFSVVQDFYICHFVNRTFSRVEKAFLEAIFNRLSFGPPRFPDSFKDLFLK
jgi:DNA-binding transcriptional LysR family regulator